MVFRLCAFCQQDSGESSAAQYVESLILGANIHTHTCHLQKKNQTGDLVVLCNLNKTVEITILHKELWNKGKQLRHRKLNTVFKYFAGWMLSKKNADSHDCVCVWDLESRSEKYYLCTPSPLVEEPLGLSSPCLKACILWASPFFQCFLLDCG